jgi:hypothetical protein
MTEVIEIESVVHTVVVEGDPSPTSVLVEVFEGQAVVDGSTVGDAVGSVEVTGGSVDAVEIFAGVDLEVVEVAGQSGAQGPAGPQGPPGQNPDDIPSMTLIFENGLI